MAEDQLIPILGVQSRRIHISDLRALNIIKVPQVVYQAMYDMALDHQASAESKWKVMRLLEEWIEETYPGWTMTASVELGLADIPEAERQVAGITFGIYVKIAPITARTLPHEDTAGNLD